MLAQERAHLEFPHKGCELEQKGISGDWLTLGSPVFLSDSPMVEPQRAPGLGADTDEILRVDLALSEAQITDLHESGVV